MGELILCPSLECSFKKYYTDAGDGPIAQFAQKVGLKGEKLLKFKISVEEFMNAQRKTMHAE